MYSVSDAPVNLRFEGECVSGALRGKGVRCGMGGNGEEWLVGDISQ